MSSHFIHGLPKRNLLLVATSILVLNLLSWGMLWYLKSVSITVLGIGALAYFFGLRHAFDADHIAAIDNVTRKLRQDGQMPVGVGFFFSLGHSTIVLLLTMALIFLLSQTHGRLEWFKEWGGTFSTTVSAGFLTAIGILNLIIFMQLYKAYKINQTDIAITDAKLDEMLSNRGFWAKIFRGLNRHINKSYKMFAVGFLFGLGFDTATEIAVLSISADAAKNGLLPLWGVLVYPMLFGAGMTLMDSIDGILMLKAYDWAMKDSLRKLFFNLSITGMSVLVALLIGTIEWIQLFGEKFGAEGAFWSILKELSFGQLGIVIICMMLLSWLIAWRYYKKALTQQYETDVKLE
jgi:high-affinity nickel-transport protein